MLGVSSDPLDKYDQGGIGASRRDGQIGQGVFAASKLLDILK